MTFVRKFINTRDSYGVFSLLTHIKHPSCESKPYITLFCVAFSVFHSLPVSSCPLTSFYLSVNHSVQHPRANRGGPCGPVAAGGHRRHPAVPPASHGRPHRRRLTNRRQVFHRSPAGAGGRWVGGRGRVKVER